MVGRFYHVRVVLVPWYVGLCQFWYNGIEVLPG